MEEKIEKEEAEKLEKTNEDESKETPKANKEKPARKLVSLMKEIDTEFNKYGFSISDITEEKIDDNKCNELGFTKIESSEQFGQIAQTEESNKAEQTGESKRKVTSLMQEADEIAKELGITMNFIFEKKGEHLIDEEVKKMSGDVQQQAKSLRQKMEKVKEIKDNSLRQYKDCLTKIEKQYEMIHKATLQQRIINQRQERKAMLREYRWRQTRKTIKESPQFAKQREKEGQLKEEIKKVLDKGNADTAVAKNKELKQLERKNPLGLCDEEIERTQTQRFYIQQLINQCDQELESIKIERKSRIQQATQDKDNQLVTVEKQGLFKRIFGAIKNKISGAKMFRDNVIGKLAEKIEFIRQDQIPQLERDTLNNITYMNQNMEKRRQKILGKNAETKEQLLQMLESNLIVQPEAEIQSSRKPEEDIIEVG